MLAGLDITLLLGTKTSLAVIITERTPRNDGATSPSLTARISAKIASEKCPWVKQDQDATREIIIIMEHSEYCYSNAAPYEITKFYLVKNKDFDNTDFNRKKEAAETLCRTVMLFGFDSLLLDILNQQRIELFGDERKDEVLPTQHSYVNSRTVKAAIQPNSFKQNYF
ncbi:unnamed protein product [Didymodactylos carnosus]|uniref:Uncharacterized protein n=1 Tax=Didymodactylos carnosus TaxID=1234261 RepID=A0A815FGG1_9BILA|nr:unnamed protein product [Didymodactylos carnosus]CAF4179774.1 unnamed protein product [Didymodactylos carnosus]